MFIRYKRFTFWGCTNSRPLISLIISCFAEKDTSLRFFTNVNINIPKATNASPPRTSEFFKINRSPPEIGMKVKNIKTPYFINNEKG